MLNLLKLQHPSAMLGIYQRCHIGSTESGRARDFGIDSKQPKPEGCIDRRPGRRNVRQSSTPKVKAGQQITRGKFGSGPGGHVLGMPSIGTGAAAKDANSPKSEQCCNFECNSPFGQVVPETLDTIPEQVIQASIKFGAEVFAVDATLIQVASDSNSLNDIQKIGQIAGVCDLGRCGIKSWKDASNG